MTHGDETDEGRDDRPAAVRIPHQIFVEALESDDGRLFALERTGRARKFGPRRRHFRVFLRREKRRVRFYTMNLGSAHEQEWRAWDLVMVNGARHLGCARSGSVLCAARENDKTRALRIDRPIQAANPLIDDPQRFIDAAVQFRQFYCPACGGLIENEVSRAEDPLLRNIELAG